MSASQHVPKQKLAWRAKKHFLFYPGRALSASMLTTPLTSADKDADPPADIAADNGLPGRPQGYLIAAGRRMIWLKKSLHHRPAWRDFGGKNTSISRQEMTPKTKEFHHATRTRNIFRSTFS